MKENKLNILITLITLTIMLNITFAKDNNEILKEFKDIKESNMELIISQQREINQYKAALNKQNIEIQKLIPYINKLKKQASINKCPLV